MARPPLRTFRSNINSDLALAVSAHCNCRNGARGFATEPRQDHMALVASIDRHIPSDQDCCRELYPVEAEACERQLTHSVRAVLG